MPHDAVTDVTGIRVGSFERIEPGWCTGTTVVLAPPRGAVGGVDVRGGAPGTRETDLLAPGNLVERVHAIVLTGGSAYGLAAASGVADALGAAGVGFPVGSAPGEVVPIVPAAVIFDLGRGGSFAARPDAGFGAAALDAATDAMPASGCVGAGAGAVVGGLKGGVGHASQRLSTGAIVAALAVVNAAGSAVDPRTGLPYAALIDPSDAFAGLAEPSADERAALASARAPNSLNTTIGVIVTDFTLDKAGCRRLATVAHDGLARAVRPAHGLVDGDTIFALSTEVMAAPADAYAAVAAIEELLTAGADCFARAIGRAVLTASSVGAGAGQRAYRDLAPSAVSGWLEARR